MTVKAHAIAAVATLVLVSTVQAQDSTMVWESGFEASFPGEFLSYDDGSYSSNGSTLTDRSATWAIIDRASGEPVYSGDHAYKGWIERSDSSSHRAYPVIHTEIPTPLVNSFMVYLDVDYDQMGELDWVHFATWGNNPDWAVHTMSVRNRRLEMAHLDWRWVGPSPQPAFPLRRWVRFTVYIHYPPAGDGSVVVWQDGERVIEGTYTARQGSSLQRAHWGMYARSSVDHGVQYNDDIRIWQLSSPLTSFESEPLPPGVTDPEPGDPDDETEPDDEAEPDGETEPDDEADPGPGTPDEPDPGMDGDDPNDGSEHSEEDEADEPPPSGTPPYAADAGIAASPRLDDTRVATGGCSTTPGAPGSAAMFVALGALLWMRRRRALAPARARHRETIAMRRRARSDSR